MIALVVLLVAAVAAASSSSSTAESSSGTLSAFKFAGSATTESSSATSDSSSTSTSDTESSDALRGQRLARDQRRIELAVQAALLKDRDEPALPLTRKFNSRSYQAAFTTLVDLLPSDPFNAPDAVPTVSAVFGPAAVVAYTSPVTGLFGPENVRRTVVALDTRDNFGTLFSDVRRAGFLGEFDLRTIVQTDATARFSLRSRALLTPCFPVTDEPGLTIELLVLTQGSIVGQVREKYLAREKFLRSGDFLDSDDFAPENVNLKKFDANTGRFIESKQDVATLTLSECEQFSYFA